MEDKKKPQQQEYRFKIIEVGGIPYRVPQIRGSNQSAFEDKGYSKRAEIFSRQEVEEQEAKVEECTVDVGGVMGRAFPAAEEKQAVPKKRGEERQKRGASSKPEYTHFLSIPVGHEETIKTNYLKIQEQLSSLTKMPLKSLSSPSMLHLTILMLDLSQQEKLAKAQALLTSLLPKIQTQFMKTPMNLTFKGLQTFQDKNPNEARVLYFEVKQDEGHGRLKSMASFIIDQFVTEGIIRQDELSKSHNIYVSLSQVKFNPSLGYYDMKFHLSLINSKRSETFNAKPAIDKFKEASLGTFTVSQIHISSRSQIDEDSGERVERRESRGQGYYACDGKIQLVE